MRSGLWCLVAALVAAVTPAQGDTTLVTAGLRGGWTTEAGTQMAGLDLHLAPGWKTYWRSPGEAGIPPQFDWTGSDNVAAARIQWPAPTVFTFNGLQSIGYTGDVVLPVEVTPRDPAKPVRLVGQIDLGVCRDVCVPATVRVDAVLLRPGAADPAIRAALDARPLPARQAGLRAAHCAVTPIADGLRIEAVLDLPPAGGAETVVIEAGMPGVWVSDAAVRRDGRQLRAVADMVGPSGAPFALDRGALVLTVLGDRRAVELRGCPGS